jgi:type I restriction enzyme M protein
MRANMPKFGKRTPFTASYFEEFEVAYGDKPDGSSPRSDQGEAGRFRIFSRAWIAERSDSLDIAWLKDENTEDAADLPEPAVLAQEAMGELAAAMAELQGILAELGEEVAV